MLTRFSMRRTLLVAAILLSAAISAARAATPEVLTAVPGDAYAVVVIGNVRSMANSLANAATRLSITLPSPDLAGYAVRSMGITTGFDYNGSAALVLLKPADDKAAEGYLKSIPPAVLLLPTTNPNLLLGKFDPTDPDKDGISQVTLPDNPEEKGFVAAVDKKWVALATKKEDLQAYLKRGDPFTKTVSPETLKVFESNDVVIWGNVAKLGAGVDKMLDDRQAELIGMFDLANLANAQDALGSAVEKHGIGMIFDLTKQFFKDSSASMITLRLTDAGATLGMIADFKADTAMGKFVTAQGGLGPLSLKGLPAGNFLMAGAGKWNSATVADAFGGFLDDILKDPALTGDSRLPELKKSLVAGKQVIQIMQGGSMMLLEPAADGKGGYFNGAMLVETSDPKKYFDLEIQNASGALSQMTMNPDMKTAVNVTPNALTVKAIPLAKITVAFVMREATPENPIKPENQIALDMIKRIYGENGMTMYMGIVGKRVLLVYGSDENLIESAVTAAQTDSDALSASPEITASKTELVTNPVMIAYLPIARWVTLAQGILGINAGGAPLPPAGPAIMNAPPVVISAGVTGKMLKAEIHVPIGAITGTQEAIKRMEQAAQGGRGGVPFVPGLP